MITSQGYLFPKLSITLNKKNKIEFSYLKEIFPPNTEHNYEIH
jgi:hypothetical protein